MDHPGLSHPCRCIRIYTYMQMDGAEFVPELDGLGSLLQETVW
jgi:hypothetical protein